MPPAHLRSAVAELDVTGLTHVLQNYVAAMVDQAAHAAGVPSPGWTLEVPRLAVMPVVWNTFELRPFDFFGRNPALRAPTRP